MSFYFCFLLIIHHFYSIFFIRILSSRCLALLLTTRIMDEKDLPVYDCSSLSSSSSSSFSSSNTLLKNSAQESSSEVLRILLPNCLSPSLSKRHGALLGVSEIILSTSLNFRFDPQGSAVNQPFSGLKIAIFLFRFNFLVLDSWINFSVWDSSSSSAPSLIPSSSSSEFLSM